MSLIVECPQCGARLKAAEHLAGKSARCRCGQSLTIPKASSATVDSPPTPDSSSCTGCGAPMPPNAFICTNCGLNAHTGEYLRVSVEQTTPAATSGGERRAAAPSRAAGAIGSGVASLIKPVLILLALAAVGWIGWSVWEFVRFDPAAQANAKLAKLGPGMSVAQVVAVAGRPQQAYAWADDESSKSEEAIPRQAFVTYQDNFMEFYSKEKLKYGFVFVYFFTAAAAHEVHFDERGVSVAVAERPNLFRQ